MNSDAEKYDWFVCVENKPMKWSCVKTTPMLALHAPRDTAEARTMAIPVSKFMPQILEKWYVKQAIKDHLVVAVK